MRRAPLAAILSATLALSASCNNYELFRVAGYEQASFSNEADIIFIVDNSPSMVGESEALALNFGVFLDTLLANARVRHFQEWWAQYVEQAVLGADLRTYRQVFFLVASLLRRLGRSEEDNASNLRREAYMWTRIKQHLARTGVAPEDALYVYLLGRATLGAEDGLQRMQ